MQLDICKLSTSRKQLASSLWIKSRQSTCIKPVDNLLQTCYHQSVASNANASYHCRYCRYPEVLHIGRLAATFGFLAMGKVDRLNILSLLEFRTNMTQIIYTGCYKLIKLVILTCFIYTISDLPEQFVEV